MRPEEFWQLTYGEFLALMNGYNQRDRDVHNRLIYAAWHCEAFHRVQQLRPVDEYYQGEDPASEPRQMTDEQMMAMARVLNAALGGNEVEV